MTRFKTHGHIGTWKHGPNYHEVEYIQSDKNQYIDTGINVDQNTIVEMKFSIPQSSNYQRFYGAWNGQSDSSNREFSLQHDYPDFSTIRAYNYSKNSSSITASVSLNTDYTIKHTNTQLYVNGTLKGTVSATTYSLNYPLYIFTLDNQGTGTSSSTYMKLYWFKLYSGETLVRDFVPCYLDDGRIGLRDKVTNQFFENKGTGTFTKGPDV